MPAKLRKGGKIAIVGLASAGDKNLLDQAVTNIKNYGYDVEIDPTCFLNWHGFAGSDQERAKALNRLFADNSINAIMAMRGGFGSIRILDQIDYSVIKKNSKIFIGFSDITSLHMAFFSQAQLQTIHGPMAISNFAQKDDITAQSLFSLMGGQTKTLLSELNILKNGTAKGVLIGGNLTVLMSGLGTKYDVDFKGKILFLEDIGEASYRIDRMLTQLLLMGRLQGLKGIILGNFKNCNSSGNELSLQEIFEEKFSRFNIPVVYNAAVGHCTPNLSLPFGTEVLLDTQSKTLTLIGNAVR
ncbi:muramoyltetrapeptide carboxypeptidase [Brevinema andersonii]|uniref:Muramoyltetrapeptide carboxypeptidase n=1 Tax=Brevinema andersonii TaxID=34097 RepID=A0A1I1D9Z0_BREAD|nr:LD-carboxypeptidase [Brevinema andersonii]SFB71624.1 muramoyltetrapeptide carboxypeptidase [Brevinema andersonii]